MMEDEKRVILSQAPVSHSSELNQIKRGWGRFAHDHDHDYDCAFFVEC